MLELGKMNVLEENEYEYELQDVAEPNLYRELYEYDTIPKISFNHRLVPQKCRIRYGLQIRRFEMANRRALRLP